MTTQATYKEAGSGPAIIFLHGIGGNQASFDNQLPHFAANWRAISWDMPGYGASEEVSEMNFADLADTACRLLDDLEIDQAVMVGHSMGGMVVQEFLVRHPDRIRAAVLSCTSAAFGSSDGEFKRKFLEPRLAPLDRGETPADFASPLVDGMMGDYRTDAIHAQAMATMEELSPVTYRAALNCLVTFDQRENLANIACPILCLAAEKDNAAPPKGMARMSSKIAGASYVCIPGAGHLVNIERPEQFNAAIDDFVNTL